MTEAEWLACRDPGPMAAYLWTPRPAKPENARRLRLLGCACVRALGPLLRQSASQEALACAERYADGEATDKELDNASELGRAGVEAERAGLGHSPHWFAAEAARQLTVKGYNGGRHPSYAEASRTAANGWARHQVQTGQGADQPTLLSRRLAEHANWLRDIFGNPFQTITFLSEWRTDTAVAIVRAMYASHEFDGMPILADALQDVGCDNEHLLNHCRDANQTHHRGCWVVDLVLGKA